MLLLFTRVMYIVCIVYFFHFSFCFLRIIYVVHDVLLILHVVSLSRGSIVSMGLSLSLSISLSLFLFSRPPLPLLRPSTSQEPSSSALPLKRQSLRYTEAR